MLLSISLHHAPRRQSLCVHDTPAGKWGHACLAVLCVELLRWRSRALLSQACALRSASALGVDNGSPGLTLRLSQWTLVLLLDGS